MANRSMLKAQIKRAWRHTIQSHYQNQHINSERGLQAFFCAALLNEFQDAGIAKNRRIFVEPGLAVGRSAILRKPDILICNTRSIIAVIELKYKPMSRPRIQKDLETLEWMASHPHGVRVKNDRYLGIVRDGKEYSLKENAILCWAGVHREMNELISKRVSARVRPYFLELHATTSATDDPVIT